MESYFEGFQISGRLCQKCKKRNADWVFEGKPPTEPEVLIFVCNECRSTLPENIFRFSLMQDVDVKK